MVVTPPPSPLSPGGRGVPCVCGWILFGLKQFLTRPWLSLFSSILRISPWSSDKRGKSIEPSSSEIFAASTTGLGWYVACFTMRWWRSLTPRGKILACLTLSGLTPTWPTATTTWSLCRGICELLFALQRCLMGNFYTALPAASLCTCSILFWTSSRQLLTSGEDRRSLKAY